MRILLERVFVLHRRAYGNSSLIVELFSRQYGRFAAIARSARGMRSRFQGKLQLFTPMLASWCGRRELMTLTQIELDDMPMMLEQKALFSGFYLNELLMRSIIRDDPCPKLFDNYHHTLQALAAGAPIEPELRYFEKHLLEEIGYGLILHREARWQQQIKSDCFYQYIPERGFLQCEQEVINISTYSGKSLLALHYGQLNDKNTMQDAKRLMRFIFNHHFGEKKINSRDLMF